MGRLVDLEMMVHARTGSAVKVSDDGDAKNAVWLPLSAVELEETQAENTFIVTMPETLAIEKGLA